MQQVKSMYWGVKNKYLSFFISLFLVLFFSANSLGQTTLVEWNFPNNPDNATSDVGQIQQVFCSQTINFTLLGNTTYCASASGWDNGANCKYWKIQFSSTGYSHITINSTQKSSDTGPRDFKFQYSLDNNSWKDVSGGIVQVTNGWTNKGALAGLILPYECENKPVVYLRWLMFSNSSADANVTPGSVVQTTGTSRIDDIQVKGCNTLTTSLLPALGPVGTKVLIAGVNLSGITNVKFTGNINASFRILSQTQIEVVVPQGALSGPIYLTGTCTTASLPFQVISVSSKGSGTGGLIISEMCDPSSNYAQDRFIEIFNPTNAPINMADYELRAISNGSECVVWPMTGIIQPGEAVTFGYTNPSSGGPHNFSTNAWYAASGATCCGEWNATRQDGAVLYKQGVISDYAVYENSTTDWFANHSVYRNENISQPSSTFNLSQWTVSSAVVTNAGLSPATPRLHSTTFNETPPIITVQPVPVSTVPGIAANFHVESPTPGVTYQWKMLDNSGNWINVSGSGYSGATTAYLTVNTSGFTSGIYQYYLQVTSATGNSYIASNVATLELSDMFTINKNLTAPPHPAPGDYVTYTITYKNTSSLTAHNVVITDMLPPTSLFSVAEISGGGVSASTSITWIIPTVQPDESGSFVVKGYWGQKGGDSYDPLAYYISSGTSTSTISNSVSIKSNESPTPITDNVTNTVEQYCGITFPNGNDYLKQGVDKIIYYPMTIKNTGNIYDNFSLSVPSSLTSNGDILNLQILDLDKNLLSPSQTGWLPPGGSFAFLLELDGTSTAQKPKAGDIFNIVVTASSTVCSNCTKISTVTTTVYNGQPPTGVDLAVTKYADHPTYTVGSGPLKYTIILTNIGATAATGVTLKDILSTSVVSNTTMPTISPPGTLIGNTITWSNITVNPNQILTYAVTTYPTCQSVPELINSATVTSTTDFNPSNNNVTITTDVISNAILPSAYATPAVTCAGSSVTLSASNAITGETYRWYTSATGSVYFGTGQSVSVTVTQSTTFYVSIYNPTNQCETNRTPVYVEVNPLPQGSLTGNVPFCGTGTGALTWAATEGTGPFILYYSDGTSNYTQSGVISEVPFTVLPHPLTATRTFTLIWVEDNNGCRRTSGFTNAAVTITVNPLPVCSILGTGSICPSSSNTYTAPAGMSSYGWSLNNANGATITTGASSPTVTVQAGNSCSTTYELQLTITNANGCSATCLKTIEVKDDTPPLITCNVSQTQTVNVNTGNTYKHSGTTWDATATDGCLASPVLTVSLSGATTGGPFTSLDNIIFNTGTTTATWTANDGCNTSACSFNVVVLGTADLQITKTGPATANVGDAVTYTLTVTNNGPADAPVVTVTDNMPATIVSPQYSTDNGATWLTWNGSYQLPSTLANGASKTILIKGVAGCSAVGTLTNTATVALSPITDPNLANNTASCTVTIIDNLPPTFTLPSALTECVNSIIEATYNPDKKDINPTRPDYYIFKSGDTKLDIMAVSDNCCTPTIAWKIDFADGTSVSGMGQPLTHTGDIHIPGDGQTFAPLKHTITYIVTDCHNNVTIKTADIFINPRPKLTITN